MNNITITPPRPPHRRRHIFSVRLTTTERDAIIQLAQEMNVSPSHLARHFLMQAISQFSGHLSGSDA